MSVRARGIHESASSASLTALEDNALVRLVCSPASIAGALAQPAISEDYMPPDMSLDSLQKSACSSNQLTAFSARASCSTDRSRNLVASITEFKAASSACLIILVSQSSSLGSTVKLGLALGGTVNKESKSSDGTSVGASINSARSWCTSLEKGLGLVHSNGGRRPCALESLAASSR